MRQQTRSHSPAFKASKAKVAIEAIRGGMTPADMASKFEIHPTHIARW